MTEPRSLARATLGALGVVYGDIGTSPLYALKGATMIAGGADDRSVVLGVLSMIFWSLFIVIVLKYIVLILRSDNAGEGGILSLLALVQQKFGTTSVWAVRFAGIAALGTALFYCDGMITPAISVLSAVEGLELIKPDLANAVVPVTLGVLAVLFLVQRRGTAHVAKLFGPIMVVWFLTLAVSGVIFILRAPQVLAAVDPRYGITLLVTHPGVALAVIGAVFLALTGGEALYADMGHFGKTPVRIAWFSLVLPSLLLNYYGQGALYLTEGPVPRPLYSMMSAQILPFMLVLATAATVIASQATISGAFSLARQAVQLDLLPRLRVLQTSAEEQGQIYVPAVNATLFIAVVGFVLSFQNSDALSAAYGAAVIGTMAMTTVLGSYVAWTQWNWPKPLVVLVFTLLAFMDLSFLVGNLTKVDDGGWIPLSMAACLFVVFYTWRWGRAELKAALAEMALPIAKVGSLLEGVTRVPGTGVYLASDADVVPSALIRNLEHNHVAHERVVILNIDIARTPRRDPAHRVTVEEMLPQVYRVTAHFGFMETPDIGAAMRSMRSRGLRVFTEDCSFFVGQHVVLARPLPGWRGLRRKLFARMQRRSAPSAEFFRMPGRGLVILTTAVEV